MKYMSLFCLLFVITISGCSLVSSPDWPITYEWKQYYSITWTLLYHNPELDRWEGKESWATHRIVSLVVKREDFPYFSDFFEASGGYYPPVEGDTGIILLGCSTGNYEFLSAHVILPDTINAEGRYATIQQPMTINLPTYSSSWSIIHALITKPIFSYPLASDLPDIGRLNSCEALAEIKDIQTIN